MAHIARLKKPQADGTIPWNHYVGAAERGNVRAQEMLDGPPFPDAIDYLWKWFAELDSTRVYGMDGPTAIRHIDIFAWANLSRTSITPEEVTALMRMDRVWLHPPKEDPAK